MRERGHSNGLSARWKLAAAILAASNFGTRVPLPFVVADRTDERVKIGNPVYEEAGGGGKVQFGTFVKTQDVGLRGIVAIGDFISLESDSDPRLMNDADKCFTDTAMLKGKIKEYVKQRCAANSTCAVGQEYGHPINSWCVGRVTSFHKLFRDISFNGDISGWETGNVTDMSWMFEGVSRFNQPIGSWDTSKVTNMNYMFSGASRFNQLIDRWNTSKITDMNWMFYYASQFNQPLGSWVTSKVTNMQAMFRGASEFNQPVGNWTTSEVTDMSWMFEKASKFNQMIGSWDTRKVMSMEQMFSRASEFDHPIDSWNTSKVAVMKEMFEGASKFNQTLCGWGKYYGNSDVYYEDMFQDSACPTKGDPSSDNGPWCHDCNNKETRIVEPTTTSEPSKSPSTKSSINSTTAKPTISMPSLSPTVTSMPSRSSMTTTSPPSPSSRSTSATFDKIAMAMVGGGMFLFCALH
eukprot:CAMPEP_0172534614 /NCGR_PEP_ID=MMETSP1067-20121228/6913_1 /TAXON_ID=265564 ORGANISM="Thalassiosira punctigera, Strain Tpunct2005C2" /NCGR_SAMPLE_ID=MMETSP1067 /ASSEMBLY_ACC=CAM_ASM_000444 /LENGTH=463 /DNA_ID=CAMNT_0013319427 /DNA_START=39 /DNA_END=1430 /DNA_ORIENTATION=-